MKKKIPDSVKRFQAAMGVLQAEEDRTKGKHEVDWHKAVKRVLKDAFATKEKWDNEKKP